MKINEKWVEKVNQGISDASDELKVVALADKLHKQLEDKSLEQVLEEYLPVSDAAELKEAASQMEEAISKMYADLKDTVTDDQVKARLNKALGGHSHQDQGKYLVNLLNCFAEVNGSEFPDSQLWQAMKEQEDFTQEEVRQLLDLAVNTINTNAGFLARQEFLVMEHSLGNESQSMTQLQMNSGSQYAKAYAAAMYITRCQSDDQKEEELEPRMLGLTAAQSVESSKLLAEYHYGKLRKEELMPKLEAIAKTTLSIAGEILVQAIALGMRLGGAKLLGSTAVKLLMALSVTNPYLLLATFVAVSAACLYNYTQKEAVNNVLTVWKEVKYVIGKVIAFFRGDNPPSPGSAGAVTVEQTNTVYSTQVQHITV